MPGFRLRRRRDRAATAHLAYPVLDGLAGRGCAFCRHEARREGDAAWSFLYEGKHASEVRAGLRAAGGFCGRHADLVLQTALRHDLTAGLAEVYEHLIAADIAGLRGGGRRWRSAPAPCPLCLRRAEAEARMARFVGERLGARAPGR